MDAALVIQRRAVSLARETEAGMSVANLDDRRVTTPVADRTLVISLSEALSSRDCGAKASNLARLIQMGQPVPDGFVVTDAALECFLAQHRLPARIASITTGLDVRAPIEIGAAAESIGGWIRDASVPPALTADLDLALAPHLTYPLIVRSSAVGEDSQEASFAGQLDSIGGVSGASQLRRALTHVWASRWSARALTYELARGSVLAGMGVVVQRQIPSAISGVLFTVAPGNAAEMLVEYCGGSGEALVAGRESPGRLTIARNNLKWSRQAEPERPVPDEARLLDAAQIAALGRRALEIEHAFGRPQDIEWTMDGEGRLWIVQARPITVSSGPRIGQPSAGVHWSNANVNENFPQPISPLLYSIARTGYYHYFRNLGRAFGFSNRRLAEMEQPLRHIIGVHGARMYYNLTSIHGVLRSAPFGELLAGWFNQFVGSEDTDAPAIVERRGTVQLDRGASPRRTPHRRRSRGPQGPAPLRRGAPVARLARYAARSKRGRSSRGEPHNGLKPDTAVISLFSEAIELAVIVARTAWQFLFVTRRVERFERTVREYAARTHPDLLRDRPRRDLLDDLRGFIDIRNNRWKDASLADAASMVCYGALERWLGSAFPAADQAALHNSLLRALPNLPSSMPALELWKLSRLVCADTALRTLIESKPADVALDAIRHDDRFSAFRLELDRFLEDWGFRCSGELMLTVPSFQEDQAPLIDIIKAYAGMERQSPADHLRAQRAERLRDTDRVAAALRRRRLLPGVPLLHQWHVVSVLLRWTQHAIVLRERARLKQALLYGRLRRVALHLGDRLVSDRRLETRNDIFFLTADEIDDLVSGCAMFPSNVQALVALRRKAHDAMGAVAWPDSMTLAEGEYCTGRQAVHSNAEATAPTARAATALTGLGVCGGTTTARAAVLNDVTQMHLLQPGDVLITRQTDPGWGAVFPLISGLVMERGGMLSHGAIIAREFGIPSVVGIAQATTLVPHGASIHVDGDRGLVRIEEHA
jgi:phosphohistidine swiveling domain-containing protein